MDYAGAQIGTLVEFGSLSAPVPGAVITSTAQIPAPVDHQFLGAPGLTVRERWLLEQLRRRAKR
jgi:hypothetical protein